MFLPILVVKQKQRQEDLILILGEDSMAVISLTVDKIPVKPTMRLEEP
jgi:hypothetical protein